MYNQVRTGGPFLQFIVQEGQLDELRPVADNMSNLHTVNIALQSNILENSRAGFFSILNISRTFAD
jgi:hypothetical protein